MKRVFSIVTVMLLLLAVVSCEQKVKVNAGPAKIEFEETSFDFGKYSILEDRSHTFVFANTGSEPLVIQDAQTTCSCTQIEFPHEPVMPGKRGKIEITYKARQKHGHFRRNVHIYSNGSAEPIMLVITGEQYR